MSESSESRLPPELAEMVMQAIEDVEREEADDQDRRKGDQPATAPDAPDA